MLPTAFSITATSIVYVSCCLILIRMMLLCRSFFSSTVSAALFVSRPISAAVFDRYGFSAVCWKAMMLIHSSDFYDSSTVYSRPQSVTPYTLSLITQHGFCTDDIPARTNAGRHIGVCKWWYRCYDLCKKANFSLQEEKCSLFTGSIFRAKYKL